MASLTVRNIDLALKEQLRVIAASNGRSMEEEVRRILKTHVLRGKSAMGIGSRIHRRFTEVGGVRLPEPTRSYPRHLEAILPEETK